VIGGLGSVTGMLIGVLFFKFLETITALGIYHEAISGAALLVVLSFVPGGLGQVVYSLRDHLLRLVANRRNILVPSLFADKRQTRGPDRSPDEEGLLIGALGGAPPPSNGADPDMPVEVLT
jgi:hypothetical protein